MPALKGCCLMSKADINGEYAKQYKKDAMRGAWNCSLGGLLLPLPVPAKIAEPK